MRSATIWFFVAFTTYFAPNIVTAQVQPNQTTPSTASQTLSAEQLNAIVAPIALYQDDLLAQVLIASTYPLEVVEADRWAKANKSFKGDALSAALSTQKWDDSVKSLALVPEVLDMMSTKLDWTQKLGDAVLAQQQDVMDAVQRMRTKAQARGKLTSTKQQKVSVRQEQSRDIIVIEPGEAENVYVPYYDPALVYGNWADPAYPPYYFPPPGYVAAAAIATGIVWGTAWAVGRAIVNGGVNWGSRNLVVNSSTINNIGNRVGNINDNRNWQHNPAHRQGVRYNNDAVRQKFGNANTGADRRLDFRGRDGQQVLRPEGRLPNAGDRQTGVDRANIGNRPTNSRPNVANRPSSDRSQIANRGSIDRPTQANRAPRRDTGFSNIQPRSRVNAQSTRGNASLGNRGGNRQAVASAPRGGARGGARGGRRSDITLKHDIVFLGHLANGVGYYRFSYNGSDRSYVGVMAQEVQAIFPAAVTRDREGFLSVYYEKLGIEFQTYQQWLASGARVPRGIQVPR